LILLDQGLGEARYERTWGIEFWAYVGEAMRPGIAVLDVGAGRRPTIAPEDRPRDVRYVGLDVSVEELELSGPGSYDEKVVADASSLVTELVDRFDLIVAWQVLEHLRDVRAAAEAFRSYTRQGGWFVTCVSGRWAAFAVANRLLPNRFGRPLVARLMGRSVDEVFEAHYDHCDERGLRMAFSKWDEIHVVPLWRGADYFERFPRLRSIYIAYEDWALRGRHLNLATHYVVAARKGRAVTCGTADSATASRR
jgi:SAM-dependent methyltransferase